MRTLYKAVRMKKYEKATPHEFTWTPILWAMKLLQKAKQEGKIQVRICANFGNFRKKLSKIKKYLRPYPNLMRSLESKLFMTPRPLIRKYTVSRQIVASNTVTKS